MKETPDWRAVCGKTARTVRREGRRKPSLPLSPTSRARRRIWPPLPLAGEGWGEGRPKAQGIENRPSSGASRHLLPQAGEGNFNREPRRRCQRMSSAGVGRLRKERAAHLPQGEGLPRLLRPYLRRPLIPPPLGRASPPPKLCGPISSSFGLCARDFGDGVLAERPYLRSPV